MRGNPREDDAQPLPEQLAAYADGELDAAGCRAVEDWLARHPEAAAEVEALRRLARLCELSAPPEPAEADWSGVLRQIKAALPERPAEPEPVRRRRPVWLWGTAALAAAVLLAAVVGWPTAPPEKTEDPQFVAEEEPWPVVSADELEINTMDHNDVAVLLVGHPPVREPLLLANAGEVSVDSVEPDADGVFPDMRLLDGPVTPMVRMPAGVAAPK